MKNVFLNYSMLAVAALSLASCENTATNSHFTPIVLGDSSTIVTETDPEYLKNNVGDLDYSKNAVSAAPSASEPFRHDTANALPAAVPEDTAVSVRPETPPSPSSANGHSIAIGNGSHIIIDVLKLKEFKTQDGTVLNDLAYLITSGKHNKTTIKLDNGKINKVTYRYQSNVLYTYNGTDIKLTSLGNNTSGWSNVSFKGNEISFPSVANATFDNVSVAQLRNAVQKELKAKKYKASVINTEVNKIGAKSKPNQAPFKVDVTAVTFKISGTDAKGKSFDKTIKLEM